MMREQILQKDVVECPQCGGERFVQINILTKFVEPMLIGTTPRFTFHPAGAYCSTCGAILDAEKCETVGERGLRKAGQQ